MPFVPNVPHNIVRTPQSHADLRPVSVNLARSTLAGISGGHFPELNQSIPFGNSIRNLARSNTIEDRCRCTHINHHHHHHHHQHQPACF